MAGCNIVTVILTWVCLCVVLSSGRESRQDVPMCTYKQHHYPQYPSLYEYHGTVVPSLAKLVLIHNMNDSDSCIINATQLINSYNFPHENVVVGIFAIACRTPVQIIFTDTESLEDLYYNVIGYFQVQGCLLESESVQTFANIFDMRVVTFTGTSEVPLHKFPFGSKRGLLGNVVALTVDGAFVVDDSDFINFLNQSDTFPEMKEITLMHMGWSELPDELMETFPYLESLELPDNHLTFPPMPFPWNNTVASLPRNLSRSSWFQSHYSLALHLDIKPNLYRRLYNLDHNNIHNLTYFQFHGSLNVITINNNGLRYIGELCFRHVNDLQHIGLANNRLTSLPEQLFMGLTSLRHLDLQNNSIVDLPSGLFSHSTNLVYLNLASNKLKVLRNGLFSKLINLEILHLDGNKFTVIEESPFPLHTIALRHISFNNNPLLQIPLITFYIRSLRRIDLRNTSISLRNLSTLLDEMNAYLLLESVIKSASDADIDIFERPKELREIDLSQSSVTGVDIDADLTKMCRTKLAIILIHFHINLAENELMCDCAIVPFLNFVRKYTENGTFTRDDYIYREWTCAAPEEFSGRKLLDIKEENTYCTTNVSNCPENCVCYRRTKSHIIIVDCRNSGLKTLPSHLPDGLLELWFQNNNITRIEPRNYLRRVRTLSISDNDIERVDRKAILQLSNILSLQLSSNNLIGLPQEMEYLRLQDLTIGDNPFSCDCHSLWLKSWIERNKDVVKDSASVTCNTQIGTARPILKVPQSEFVCKLDFDVTKHVIIPATASAITVCVVVILTVVVGIYRLEVKVFLYIYLGVRPFDKNKKLQQKPIDVFIVHSPQTQEWVTENVLSANETSATKIVDICTDLVAGFSLFENIACLMDQTRKVIFVLSIDFLPDDKLQMAWLEAMKKIADNGVGFIQFITDGVTVKDINDPGMCKVMKHTRCLKTNEHFIKNKISYLIGRDKYANKRQTSDLRYLLQRNNNANCQIPEVDCSNIFLDYSEHTRPFVVNSLYPHLKAEGYDVFLPDKDFIPGVPKDENILKYVTSACHTVLAVSKSHFDDEWSLFTFREALQKSRREKYNHLIVVTTGDIEPRVDQDEELGHYLKSHVILQADDEHFFRNLKRSLRSPLDTTDPCRQVEKSAGDRIIYNHIVNNGDIVLEL